MEDQFLVFNAKIWTSADGPEASWFTFNTSSGFITEIGGNNPPVDIFAKNSKDCGGRRIFPGFHDAHIHLYWFSKCLSQLDLSGCDSVEDLQKRLKKYADGHPEMNGIVGQKMDQDALGRYPTKEELDAVCPDKPVLLKRMCCHTAVANSLLLEKLGSSSLIYKTYKISLWWLVS